MVLTRMTVPLTLTNLPMHCDLRYFMGVTGS